MFPVYTQIYYARKWPVFIIFAIMGLPFIILKFTDEPDKGLDLFILIAMVFCTILYISARYISITIDNDGIKYQTILKKQFIAWKDVRQTKLAFELHGKSADFVWSFISTDNKQINVGIGYFSKNVIRRLAEAVVEKCPEYVINGKIKDISLGKFPWYVF